MINLQFYSTEGCHLCEEALLLCAPLLREGKISMTTVDIAESEKLVALYGIRIPVIQRIDSTAELGWPFDSDMLANFLL